MPGFNSAYSLIHVTVYYTATLATLILFAFGHTRLKKGSLETNHKLSTRTRAYKRYMFIAVRACLANNLIFLIYESISHTLQDFVLRSVRPVPSTTPRTLVPRTVCRTPSKKMKNKKNTQRYKIHLWTRTSRGILVIIRTIIWILFFLITVENFFFRD